MIQLTFHWTPEAGSEGKLINTNYCPLSHVTDPVSQIVTALIDS